MADTLNGGAGDDQLRGGDGADAINGGARDGHVPRRGWNVDRVARRRRQ